MDNHENCGSPDLVTDDLWGSMSPSPAISGPHTTVPRWSRDAAVATLRALTVQHLSSDAEPASAGTDRHTHYRSTNTG